MTEGDNRHRTTVKDRHNKIKEHEVSIGFVSEQFRDMSATSSVSVEAMQPKMTNFECFISICKGYCAINILILPKQFDNGGWLVGILSVNLACILVLYCALKLVKCSLLLKVYSYSKIAEHALGPRGKQFVDLALSLCQFSFTIAQISFSLEALQSVYGSDIS